MLQVLRAIVDNHPERIARAFEIVGQQSYRFDDRGHGYPADALQQIIDAARKRLPALPREEAARAARQLLQNNRQPPPAGRSFVDKLRAFVEEYAGTETALLTEIDVITFGLRIRERLEATGAENDRRSNNRLDFRLPPLRCLRSKLILNAKSRVFPTRA